MLFHISGEFCCRVLSKTSPTTILPRLTGHQSLQLYVSHLHILLVEIHLHTCFSIRFLRSKASWRSCGSLQASGTPTPCTSGDPAVGRGCSARSSPPRDGRVQIYIPAVEQPPKQVWFYHPRLHLRQLHHTCHGAAKHPTVVPRAEAAQLFQPYLHHRLCNWDGSQGHRKLLCFWWDSILQGQLEQDGRDLGDHIVGWWGRTQSYHNMYFKSNLLFSLDATITAIVGKKSKIFGMLRVFRLVRALRPLRVINRWLRMIEIILLNINQQIQDNTFQGTGAQIGCSDTSVQFKTDWQYCSHLLHFLYHIWHPRSSVVQGPLLLLWGTWSGITKHYKQGGMFEPHGEPVDQPEIQLWQPRPSTHVTLCPLFKGRLGGHHVPRPGRCWAGQAAEAKLQRMASRLLHIFPPSRWLLCLEHVRRSGCGELPPMQGGAGEGGEGAESCKESKENWGEEKKWVWATCITLIPT